MRHIDLDILITINCDNEIDILKEMLEKNKKRKLHKNYEDDIVLLFSVDRDFKKKIFDIAKNNNLDANLENAFRYLLKNNYDHIKNLFLDHKKQTDFSI